MELRAAAEVADDPVMRADFANGVDLHRMQAAAMNNIAMDAVNDEQRKAAKAINFGVIYGSGGALLWQPCRRGSDPRHRDVSRRRGGGRAGIKFLSRYNVFARWMRDHASQCRAQGFIAIGGLSRVIEEGWEPALQRPGAMATDPRQRSVDE